MADYSGAITYPRGFLAAGVSAGIKTSGKDLALIVSELPASTAGLFTTNLVQAAPVILNKERLPSTTVRGIVINSGNANSCTGERGLRDARAMAAFTAMLLGVPEDDVLVASTGIIGHQLPMDCITAGIEQAVSQLSVYGGTDAANAIMTTDTCSKEAVAKLYLDSVEIRVGGIAKGAGMICPNLATILAFITTDANISADLLQLALKRAAEVSFNCLTIDGDSSTNDTVIAMANGKSGGRHITEGPALDAFQEVLDAVAISLAKQIASDGEGATKLIEIVVKGAASKEDCRQIAMTIANSQLVKTAMFGCDPNWGRVLAAAGRAGVKFNPRDVWLSFGEIQLVRAGEPVEFSQNDAREYLSQKEIRVLLSVGNTNSAATVWTCDLSYDYIRINAEYHT